MNQAGIITLIKRHYHNYEVKQREYPKPTAEIYILTEKGIQMASEVLVEGIKKRFSKLKEICDFLSQKAILYMYLCTMQQGKLSARLGEFSQFSCFFDYESCLTNKLLSKHYKELSTGKHLLQAIEELKNQYQEEVKKERFNCFIQALTESNGMRNFLKQALTQLREIGLAVMSPKYTSRGEFAFNIISTSFEVIETMFNIKFPEKQEELLKKKEEIFKKEYEGFIIAFILESFLRIQIPRKEIREKASLHGVSEEEIAKFIERLFYAKGTTSKYNLNAPLKQKPVIILDEEEFKITLKRGLNNIVKSIMEGSIKI